MAAPSTTQTQQSATQSSPAGAKQQSGAQEPPTLQGERQRQVPIAREQLRSRGTRLARRQPTGLTSGGLEPFGPALFTTPFALMRRMSDELDRVLQDFGVGRTAFSPWTGRGNDLWQGWQGTEPPLWVPQVDVFERDNQLVIRADLPGLAKEDINVEARDGALVISGERRQDQEQQEEGYYRSERSYGAFLRTIPLPEGVNAAEAKASFRDGVLEVTVPEPEQLRGRKIAIQG